MNIVKFLAEAKLLLKVLIMTQEAQDTDSYSDPQ